MNSKFSRAAVSMDSSISAPDNRRGFRCWGAARLRLVFLAPLAIATIVIILLLSILHYQQEKAALQQGVIGFHALAQSFYYESIRYDTQLLQGLLHSLGHDALLNTELTRRDRAALLQHANPHFEEFKRDFNITHFYFSGPGRVNLLRVHAPLWHGDIINLITTLQAEASGMMAYGVELGPLGTFTLRVVSPWYDEDTHKLIGYVELGMETDQVLNRLEDFFDLQVVTIVYKKFLQRDKWEAGMRALGRTPHWDRFPNLVTSERSSDTISPLIVEHLKNDKIMTNNTSMEVKKGGQTYQMLHLPLMDAGGREIAKMILLADVTLPVNMMWETMYIGSIAMLSAGTILFIFFYWLVGKVGQRIEYNEQALQNLAIRDGLTGLYNHRTSYSLLEDELNRSRRYTRPLALLMLDIDHFKRVNDTCGHRAGDLVLCELSELLMHHAREIDHVCRYGGEEMILILPETDTEMAMNIAERIRKAVETQVFDVSDEKQLSITISIGVASYPVHAETKEALVTAADNAMYQAKQSGRNRVCVYTETEDKNNASLKL
jgi:diguanylate cyclase (GGDEF)-like protein